MNKILTLVLIAVFMLACTKVDLGEKKASVTIAESEKINETAEKSSAISKVYNYTHEAIGRIEDRIKIDERYETPSVIVDRVDDEIEIESFGDVI
ncbi:hypothetical protein JXB27_02695 [Candidatus Woesearchaeota archaeon]|nr:hypothetical protein [Candidatus Woesearchaeota archaeon]